MTMARRSAAARFQPSTDARVVTFDSPCTCEHDHATHVTKWSPEPATMSILAATLTSHLLILLYRLPPSLTTTSGRCTDLRGSRLASYSILWSPGRRGLSHGLQRDPIEGDFQFCPVEGSSRFWGTVRGVCDHAELETYL
jgi:hypothetical protein